MTTIVKGWHIGTELIEKLGLPANTKSVIIKILPEEVVIMTTESFVTDDQINDMINIFTKYKLTKDET